MSYGRRPYALGPYWGTATTITVPEGARLLNAIWNQWVEPHARRYVGTYDRTYFGGVGNGGEVQVASFDHDGSRAFRTMHLATKSIDDHNAPAILIDSSGILWAFYARHNVETSSYYRKALAAESLDDGWADEVTLSWSGNVTYQQVFQTSSDRIILFVRLSNNQWAYRYSDDDGANWSSEQIWNATGSWRYEIMRQHTDLDTLSVAMSWSPVDAVPHQIWLAHIDLDSGDITYPGGGAAVANLYSAGTLPIDPTDYLLVFDAGVGETVRLWDVNEHDEIVFTTWLSADFTTAEQRYVKVAPGGSVGTISTLVDAGDAIDAPSTATGYFGGMGLGDTEGVLVLAREDAGDWFVERWLTYDEGATWDTEVVDTGATKRFRPVFPRGAVDFAPVIWAEGIYSTDDDFATDLVLSATATALQDVELPVITATALGYRSVEIVLTEAGEEATTHHLYRSTTPGFTPGAGNKIGDDLGLTFDVTDEPLSGDTTYYYRAGAIHPELGEVFSLQVSVTTPPQLAFVIADATSGTLQHAADDIAVEIQYQTTLDTDPTFASPGDDVIQTGSSRYSYNVTGLTAATDYLSRARTRLSSSDPWEAWSSSVAWSTTSGVVVDVTGSGVLTPPFGYPLSGVTAEVTWAAGGTVTAVDISDDLGVSWSSLGGFTQDGVVFDSTAYADGPYIVRITTDDGCPFYHPGFLIDNGTGSTYEDDFFTLPRPDIARYWSPAVARWLPTAGVFKGSTGHIGPAAMATFGPIEPPELTSALGVCFMAEAVAVGTGAGFSWDRCQAGELLDLGIVVLGAGDFPVGSPIGVRIGIKHHFLSTAHQSTVKDPLVPFRFVGVAEASSHTRFELGIGAASVQPGGGWHAFDEPCTAAMSWTSMRTSVGGTTYKSTNKVRPYYFTLWVTRPDPTGLPARLHVRGHLDAPDAWSCNGRRRILIDETVDVQRPLPEGGTEPYEFEPGHLAFLTSKVPGNRDGDSGRFVTRWSAMLFEEVPPPYPPEPDVPLLIARACDLVLEVFDDDRETIKWSAGSTRDHATPYLVEPDSYSEQEIDVASGGATIGTVTVTVIDPTTEPGNQDAGWMTAKLAELGLADLHGRRARLNRYVNAPEGTVSMVIIDGVAGEPSMDASYAAFKFPIRDFRETERKVRITESDNPGTLLPVGVLSGYGWDADSMTYLIDPSTPLQGKFQKDGSLFDTATTGFVDLITDPGNSDAQREMAKSIRDAMFGTILKGDAAPAGLVYRTQFTGLSVLWRAQSTSDPWQEIGETLVIDGTDDLFAESEGFLVKTVSVSANVCRALRIDFGDSAAVPNIPATNQDIDLIVISRKPPSPVTPLYIEGITAGEFTKNVYDGVYSPRDENDAIVPSGIRYDTAAVLAMTEPVRFRIMAEVNDARAYLEKVIYAATGRSPALDQAGRISPVSQIAPTDFSDLDVVNNDVTEPAPDWGSGTRIINVVRFTYQRDFIPEEPEEVETPDGLADRDVIIEFRDEPSITRHGEQVLELDGAAFRAIGTEVGAPITDANTDEIGWQLADLRREHVLNRYSLGAPSMQVNVKRAPLIEMRAGDFVRVLLSWMPDYITGQRGLVALCQVMAIADLNCAWRRVTLEVVVPIEGSS